MYFGFVIRVYSFVVFWIIVILFYFLNRIVVFKRILEA